MSRISQNWVENQDYWIERTKYIEDKLSDRLHEELIKSFIDKRASVLAKGLKQDINFETKILESEQVFIDKQYIEKLKGLKLDLDLKIGALDADIKSLKKAARQNVSPEIINRIDKIIKGSSIRLENDFKIYWEKYPVAKLAPGKDYLKPEISLIIDDMIESSDKQKLKNHLDHWMSNKINIDLKDLCLKNSEQKNPQVRALSYLLYENNGVVKERKCFRNFKKLEQNDRKILRNMGIKFGRYHIFLYKLFKPSPVSLRICLWKNFHQNYFDLKPPTFGLNFIEEKNFSNNSFMLLCGFEKFGNFYVRIDILERLFMNIISLSSSENKEIKLVPEMLNLLGCSKSNFLKLIKFMSYNYFEKEKEIYFKYMPKKIKKSKPYVKKKKIIHLIY